MRNSIKRISVCALLTMLTSAASAADSKLVENPFYKYWKTFAPGSTSTYIQTTELTGSEALLVPEGEDTKVVTDKLLRVDDKAAVVETIVVEKLFLRTVKQPPTEVTYPALVKQSHINAAKEMSGATKGQETVVVQGKTYDTITLEGELSSGNEYVKRKLWYSADVPGGVVKKVTTTLIDGKLDNRVTIELKSYVVAD